MEDAWDFLFFFQVKKYISQSNLKDKSIVQIMINKILGDFKMKSIGVVTDLIDDMLRENATTQKPKILKVNKKDDETHIYNIEAENDDLHLKIYFP
jgi:adenine C2-methylase RlmN of 23S rRNA A2503 and tRNA A37